MEDAEGEAAPAPPPASLAQRAQRSFSAAARGWRTYAQQPIAPAAAALALLYLNVMSFGLLMTAYLKWRGLSETLLSLYRGGGALAGIASTLVFPALQRGLGARLCACADRICHTRD